MAAKEEKPQAGASSGGGFQATAVVVLKFLFAALLLPVVIASTSAMYKEVLGFDGAIQHFLWLGLVVYLILYFFVYDLVHVYRFGQNVMTFCFQFLKPLVNFAPYVIPVYTIIVLIIFAVLNSMGKIGEWKGLFYSLMAFTFSMHVILTAKDLYQKDSAPGKPTYFFGMQLVYILDVFFIALVMHTTVSGFSFVRFFQGLAGVTFDIYRAVFHQLF